MDRWVVRGVPATLEKSRKRHQEDEQEKAIAQARGEQDAKAAVAAEALELRWPWTPLKRKVGPPTHDDLYEKELVHHSQHLATSESLPCLPPTKRPCTWHPKVGAQSMGIRLTGGSCCLGGGHGTPRRPSRSCRDRDSSARRGRRGAHRRVAGREVRALER